MPAPTLEADFAAEGGASCSPWCRVSTLPAPSRRPRRCSSSATPSCRPITRQATGRRARLRRSDRQGAQPPLAHRSRAMGALQARPARRAHPGRRGAGHEPRPVEGGEGDRRGFLLRRGRRARDAHDLRSRRRQAVDLRLSGRRRRSNAGRDAALLRRRRSTRRRQTFVARPLFLSFRSTHEVLHAVDTVFGRELAGRSRHRPTKRIRRTVRREPGHVVLMPRTVRQKSKEAGGLDRALRRAERGGDGACRTRSPTRFCGSGTRSLPSGKRLRDGEILDPCAPSRRFRRGDEPRASQPADPDGRRRPHSGLDPYRGARSPGARRRDAAAGRRPAARRAAEEPAASA